MFRQPADPFSYIYIRTGSGPSRTGAYPYIKLRKTMDETPHALFRCLYAVFPACYFPLISMLRIFHAFIDDFLDSRSVE